DGTTALHWAVRRDETVIVTLLLGGGAVATAPNRYGISPLLIASEIGNVEVIDKLIRAGADANSANPAGETALMIAARTGKVAAARARSTAGSAPGTAPDPTRPAATNNGVAQLVQVFNTGSRGGRGGIGGTSPLVLAITNAHFELASALLDLGADPNADAQGWAPLHQLVWTRRPPVQHGLPPPVPTGNVTSLELAEKLLQYGADADVRMTREPSDGARNILNRIGSTPFLQAAKLTDIPLMKLLLEYGADPSIPTTEGATPLMAAAGVGIWQVGESAGTNEEAFEAVKICYEHGNSVNTVDANGDTAL